MSENRPEENVFRKSGVIGEALTPSITLIVPPIRLIDSLILHGGCADTVIVDGKILTRGGKVLTLNEHDLYAEAQDRATSLIRRTGLEQAVAPIWPMH
jgi:hypothetical protein